MRITPQSVQYGLPERKARRLPTAHEVADLMRGPSIPHGTMRRANYDEDDSQACSKCGDRVYTVSGRGWCDGCEEEADHAGSDGYAPHPRPPHHD